MFRDDDEAADIWLKKIGLAKERLFRFDEKDNFWSMGETGPCGPCSELFVDRGVAYGCGKSSCTVGCDCDRYMEFWNLVFMQFNRDAEGNLHPLPKPSVDTGMGLERIASILQKTETNYEIDSFLNILQKIAGLVGKTYMPKDKENFPYRVIADHARATTFLITDGVMPANEGRGYVLRRIIRRAIRYGKKIGLDRPFLHKACGFVIEEMSEAYPDIKAKGAFIERAVLAEEEQFFKTLERGLSLLDDEMNAAKGKGVLSGEVAFKLYDTFGFPVDLTRIICVEHGLTVDEAAFEKAMEKQKSQSRAHWKGGTESVVDHHYQDIAQELQDKKIQQSFLGYDSLQAQGRCLAILQKFGDEKTRLETAAISSPDITLEVVFDHSPFYAESGGQAGDRGRVTAHGFEGEVLDVSKPVDGLSVVLLKPIKGMLTIGETYLLETDRHLRALTARNHTATHMLHWALRKVLGDHVKQAGSLVNSELLRFDFSHFQAPTEAELTEIEGLINARIFSEQKVEKAEMAKEQAIAAGAIAFFGEKYGDRVRVVRVGEFSTELCGGTHVDNTAEISLFVIAQESSIAAGVRRIIAYTSQRGFEYLKSREQETRVVRSKLKAASLEDVTSKLDKLLQSERDLKKQIDKLRIQSIAQQIDTIIEEALLVKDTRVITFLCPEDDQGVKTLRELSDQILQKAPKGIVVLGMKQESENKAFLLIAKGKQVTPGFSAQELLQQLAPEINGRGGGKVDMAQAGGDRLEGLKSALNKARVLVPDMLGKD